MGSPRKMLRMRGSLVLLIFLSITLCGSQDAPPKSEVTDCQSQICTDCRSSCEGCNKCPLCSLVQEACDKGKKLTFRGQDICRNCSYCKDGKEECKRQCLLGKEEPACQECKVKCPVDD